MEEREIHLRDYLKIIDKRRYTVYTFFIIVFTIVLIGTLSATPLYMATTKVLIEKGPPSDFMRNYYYMPYDPEFYETQYQLIKSTSVAGKVVKMLSLDSRYNSLLGQANSGSSMISDSINWVKRVISIATRAAGRGANEEDAAGAVKGRGPGEREDEQTRIEGLAKVISAGISVSPVKNSRIVNISFLSTNPGLASMIANTVAKAYIEEILDMKMSSSRYTLQWMTRKAEEERTKLNKSEYALQSYMKANDIVTMENRVAIIPRKLTELSSQLVKAETKREELEELYKKIQSVVAGNLRNAETISAISNDPTVQSLRGQIIKAEQNIMELSKKFGRKHPVMIRARDDLKVLKKKRGDEIRRVISSIKNEYELAKSNESNLRSLLKRTKSEALNLNEKFIQYGVLKREADTNRQLYDALIKKIKEQSITEQIKTVNVWVIEKAETPDVPVRPRKMLNILLGLIVGVFGGVGLALFVEYLDNTIKSPEEVEDRIGLPVLGVVSVLKSKDISPDEVVLNDPKSSISEEYKAIRTAIILSSADKPPGHILITSMGPEEGKTAVAVNLAVAIAQSEHSVALVDADLRRPRIHKLFGLSNTKGLSTYLAGASSIDIVQEGPLPGLGVITSGPIPPNPSELLSSKRMPALVRTLAQRYDIVIYDSSPLLSVADSLILSKVMDGTIIVARAARTTYEEVRRGVKSLSDIKSNILGVVINALDAGKRGYYYYRHYHYYYTSEDDDGK
ncbi:tyrosine-protein kinase etk [bacterium BMS3Abin08]|nr:tyrosine-protein kinase etk [bacterium BMS3Abin08]